MNLYELANLIGTSLASFVSGNNQPCMSGDPRDRIPSGRRRQYDEACRELAHSILTAAEQAEPALAARSGAVKVEWQQIAKVIAENLPSPYALDDVWRQTSDGACFDLSQAREETKSEWKALAIALATLEPAEPAADAEPVAWGEDIGGNIVSVRMDKSRHCTVPLYTRPPENRLREALEGLLAPFSDDPCRLDHHGYCQAHFLELHCCVAKARAALAQEDRR